MQPDYFRSRFALERMKLTNIATHEDAPKATPTASRTANPHIATVSSFLAPRCRDTGLSPWLGILVLVPVVNLFIGGYLTWKQSWPSTDGIDIHCTPVGPARAAGNGRFDEVEESDALKRLEDLRDQGALTERDFLRRKARLGRDETTG